MKKIAIRKVVRVVLLQIMFGWMFAGNIMAAPEQRHCGDSLKKDDVSDPIECVCDDNTWKEYKGWGNRDFEERLCCGYVSGTICLEAPPTPTPTPEEGRSTDYILCAQINEGIQRERCENCLTADGIWTAIGCISQKPENIVRVAITIGLGLGGGVAIIMILIGAFKLSISQGDPNKTKEAKEVITSAIIGLLFVIFSITILQFIGVTVLHIPGFGE